MKKLGYFAILLAATIWGISFVSTKVLLEVFAPFQIMVFRYIFASALFLILLKIRKHKLTIEREDIKWFVLSAMFGVILYMVFEAYGLTYLNATTATLILAIIPVFIMFANRFMKSEVLTTRRRIAVAVSVLGVYLLVSGEGGSNQLIGYIFMLLAVISWVFYTFISNKLTTKYAELKVTGLQYLIATVLYSPMIFFQDINYADVTLNHWLNLIFLGFGSSAMAFYLYVISIKAIGNTIASLVINFVPVVTLVFGYIFLNEVLSTMELIGGAIILLSMAVAISDDFKYHVEIQ